MSISEVKDGHYITWTVIVPWISVEVSLYEDGSIKTMCV